MRYVAGDQTTKGHYQAHVDGAGKLIPKCITTIYPAATFACITSIHASLPFSPLPHHCNVMGVFGERACQLCLKL